MAKKVHQKNVSTKRNHRLLIALNDEEAKALDYYVKRYRKGTHTRARIVRELLMSQLIQRCESDPDLLFSDEEMR